MESTRRALNSGGISPFDFQSGISESRKIGDMTFELVGVQPTGSFDVGKVDVYLNSYQLGGQTYVLNNPALIDQFIDHGAFKDRDKTFYYHDPITITKYVPYQQGDKLWEWIKRQISNKMPKFSATLLSDPGKKVNPEQPTKPVENGESTKGLTRQVPTVVKTFNPRRRDYSEYRAKLRSRPTIYAKYAPTILIGLGTAIGFAIFKKFFANSSMSKEVEELMELKIQQRRAIERKKDLIRKMTISDSRKKRALEDANAEDIKKKQLQSELSDVDTMKNIFKDKFDKKIKKPIGRKDLKQRIKKNIGTKKAQKDIDQLTQDIKEREILRGLSTGVPPAEIGQINLGQTDDILKEGIKGGTKIISDVVSTGGNVVKSVIPGVTSVVTETSRGISDVAKESIRSGRDIVSKGISVVPTTLKGAEEVTKQVLKTGGSLAEKTIEGVKRRKAIKEKEKEKEKAKKKKDEKKEEKDDEDEEEGGDDEEDEDLTKRLLKLQGDDDDEKPDEKPGKKPKKPKLFIKPDELSDLERTMENVDLEEDFDIDLENFAEKGEESEINEFIDNQQMKDAVIPLMLHSDKMDKLWKGSTKLPIAKNVDKRFKIRRLETRGDIKEFNDKMNKEKLKIDNFMNDPKAKINVKDIFIENDIERDRLIGQISLLPKDVRTKIEENLKKKPEYNAMPETEQEKIKNTAFDQARQERLIKNRRVKKLAKRIRKQRELSQLIQNRAVDRIKELKRLDLSERRKKIIEENQIGRPRESAKNILNKLVMVKTKDIEKGRALVEKAKRIAQEERGIFKRILNLPENGMKYNIMNKFTDDMTIKDFKRTIKEEQIKLKRYKDVIKDELIDPELNTVPLIDNSNVGKFSKSISENAKLVEDDPDRLTVMIKVYRNLKYAAKNKDANKLTIDFELSELEKKRNLAFKKLKDKSTNKKEDDIIETKDEIEQDVIIEEKFPTIPKEVPGKKKKTEKKE